LYYKDARVHCEVLNIRAEPGINPTQDLKPDRKNFWRIDYIGVILLVISMGSLEMQISKNIDPLLRWAAQTEFTAENIVFLREVRDYKKKWTDVAKHGPLSEDQRREQYEDAALIYFTLVNPLTAKFNVNLDHRTYLALKEIFHGVRYAPYEDKSSSRRSSKSDNVIAPWEDYDSTPSFSMSDTSNDSNAVSDFEKVALPTAEIKLGEDDKDSHDPLLSMIPNDFTINLFDKAYDVVKQDVFLNTWPKYEARYAKPRPSTSSLPASETTSERDGSPTARKRMSAGLLSRFSFGGK